MPPIMYDYVIPTIHISSCLFLIVVVLLQTGKGADMGAVFGGGSQTLFGSSGAGNFLTKLTTATAIIFMLTSLILTYGRSRSSTDNLLQRLPETPATATVPAPAPPTGDAAAPAATDQPPPAADAAGEPAAEAPAPGAAAGEPTAAAEPETAAPAGAGPNAPAPAADAAPPAPAGDAPTADAPAPKADAAQPPAQ